MFSLSAESTVMITWTSFRNPFGNSGLIGLSVSLQERIASVLGRPSLRKKLPGILPIAYSRSSKSIVRGKKSIPSRGLSLTTAVASSTVSP